MKDEIKTSFKQLRRFQHLLGLLIILWSITLTTQLVNGVASANNPCSGDYSEIGQLIDPNFDCWTWSDEIEQNVEYHFNVSKFSVYGEVVTEHSNDEISVVEGSRIIITPTVILNQNNYLKLTQTDDATLPFSIKIDKRALNISTIAAEFIFPNQIYWKNGTVSNLFELYISGYYENTSPHLRYYVAEEDFCFENVDLRSIQTVCRNFNTGILSNFEYRFLEGSIKYEYLGTGFEDQNEEIKDQTKFYETYNLSINNIFVSFGLILPVIMKIYSKKSS